ncbi:MAG: hypothetical protein H7258_07770 [Ferruginibacter sp.]|nr:hypothetical protein [Ferruginibacter sp.]
MPQKDSLLIQSIFDDNDINSLQMPGLHARLAVYINQLIINNFEDLIYILYRVDVSEAKLKSLLKANVNSDAGEMIATLIIERQVQKIISRREHRRDNNGINEDESW